MSELDVNMFAGAGGMARGIKSVGFDPTFLYEDDSDAWRTLKANKLARRDPPEWDDHEGDVTHVDWRKVKGRVRLIAAGVPCQPFSLAGKHRADGDGRNLFPELVRAIRYLHPKAVVVENVQGLLRDTFRPYFEYLLRKLECPSMKPRSEELWRKHDKRIRHHQCKPGYEPEYQVVWRLLEAADYGVPQNRRRIFIVATRRDLPTYRFPDPTHSRIALLRSQANGDYWDAHGLSKPKRPRTQPALPESDGLKPWVTVRDALRGLPPPGTTEEDSKLIHWAIPGAKAYHGHDGSRLDWPSKTIKAGVHGVPGGENSIVDEHGKFRYYTLREAARIQSFPDAHLFIGARLQITRQIGNAVPPKLAAAVARPLYRLLSDGGR
jgi:DNA (cytosine-5)-methyltransferase 1